MQPLLKNALFLIAACALSTSASAHIGIENHEPLGFLSGFLHPFSGIDHLATMVAVGLWSALTARRAGTDLLWAPLGFASMVLAGAVVGLQGVAIPAVEPMIAASLLVIGLLVVSRLRIPGAVAALTVGAFAIFHGLAHGAELAGSANATATLAGLISATVLLHATGLMVGWSLRRAPLWAPRVAGASVAVLGGAMLLQLA
jgi:urease accessory protein